MRYIHQKPVKAGLAKTAGEYCYSSWANDYLGLGNLHVCMTESVIRRYTLAELTAWVDMPMSERYGCIDIDERRVIPDIEIRDAAINACGLRSISDFQLLTLERRKNVVREVMLSLDVRPRQLARVTGMNYETIRNIAKKWHENRHPYPGGCPHELESCSFRFFLDMAARRPMVRDKEEMRKNKEAGGTGASGFFYYVLH